MHRNGKRFGGLVWGVMFLAATAGPALTHEGEDHDHDHAPAHGDGATHRHVDYSFYEEPNPYPEPMPAGDGEHWYKGNLHTHTIWSDGDQFPEVVTQWYVAHGYHFLALSDHNILSRGERWVNDANHRLIRTERGQEVVELYQERFGDWVQTRERDGHKEVRLQPLSEFRHLFERAGRFLMVESEEITQGSHVVHVNATNIAELIEPKTGGNVSETIELNVDAVVEQSEELGRPMMPHVNHPNFRWAVRAEDLIPIENLQFFEIYNGHRGVNNDGDETHVDLERMWDIILTQRLAQEGLGVVFGLAVDDAHNYEESYSQTARPGRGWVMVRAAHLTPDHLVKAMQGGEFYSSTGVTLRQVEATDAAIELEIEPEEGVSYEVEFIGTRQGYDAESEPVRDEDGETLNVTRRYSEDVGEVLAVSEGATARYEFEGDEIYVRARVTSSKEHPNPFKEGEPERAWVQPVVVGGE